MGDYRSGHVQYGGSVGRQDLPVGARVLIIAIVLAILGVSGYLAYLVLRPEDDAAKLEGERIAFVSSCELVTAVTKGIKDGAKIRISGTVVEKGLKSPCTDVKTGVRTGVIVYDSQGKWFVCCMNTSALQIGDSLDLYGTYSGIEGNTELPWLEMRYVRRN